MLTSVGGTLRSVCLNELTAVDIAGAPLLAREEPASLATVNNDIASGTIQCRNNCPKLV